MKLKSKLLLLLLIISIIPLIILSYISYDFSVKIITEQIEQQILKCSTETQEKISNLLSEEKERINQISINQNFLLWVKNFKDKQEQVEFLKDIFNLNFKHFIDSNYGYNNLFFFDKELNILYNVYEDDKIALSNLFNIKNEIFSHITFETGKFKKFYFFKQIIIENILYGYLALDYDISNIQKTIETIELGNLKTFKIILIKDENIITETKNEITFDKNIIFDKNYNTFEWIRKDTSEYLLYKTVLNDWTSILLVEKDEILYPVYRLSNTALWFTGIVIIFSIAISLIFSNNFVKPIEDLTLHATNIAKGNLNEKIFINSGDEVGTLATNFDIMRETIKQHIEKLDLKVMERTQEITDLLNNAGQGFLTFGKNLKIHKEYSKPCVDFIGRQIENMNILEILHNKDYEDYKNNPEKFNDETDIVVTEELIKDIFWREKNIGVMLTLLPKEIYIHNLILTIKYVYLKNDNFSDKSKIMLIITDVTQERKLKEKAEIEEERNNLIIKVALDKTGFIEFVNDLNLSITNSRELVNKDVYDSKDFDELFRTIHTVKGNAPFYNLTKVSVTAHKMESLISEIIKKKVYSEKNKEELNEYLDLMISGLNTHLNTISDLLTINEILTTGEKIFEVPESKINSLITLINEKLPAPEKKILIEKVNELKKYSIKFILKRYVSNAKQLSHRLNKELNPIQIVNEDLQIDYIYFKEFFDVYIHIIRNAVDHGIELPAVRKQKGKNSQGNIKIFLEEIIENNIKYLKIVTKDDGKGIDVHKIKEKLIKNNIISKDKIDKLSQNKIIEYIFHSGFSSKDTITNISGRGIGMGAVKNVVDKYNGIIDIKTVIDKGTEISIKLPYK